MEVSVRSAQGWAVSISRMRSRAVRAMSDAMGRSGHLTTALTVHNSQTRGK